MTKEEHITYNDRLTGVIFVPKHKVFKRAKLHVRYSVSNKADSISFSDDKDFMVQFDVESLKKLLDRYEEVKNE